MSLFAQLIDSKALMLAVRASAQLAALPKRFYTKATRGEIAEYKNGQGQHLTHQELFEREQRWKRMNEAARKERLRKERDDVL